MVVVADRLHLQQSIAWSKADDVRSSHLHPLGGDVQSFLFEVELAPARADQLTGPDEGQGDQLHRKASQAQSFSVLLSRAKERDVGIPAVGALFFFALIAVLCPP